MYNARECRCVCKNLNEECDEHEEKLWDPQTCTCQCVEEHECTTGYKFNYNTCRWAIFNNQ